MKNQSRIRKNGSPTGPAAQLKTKLHQAAAPRRHRPSGAITCVWTGSDGSEFARVEFPGELFARIELVASKLGITLEQFFDYAIRDFVRSQAVRRAA